MQITVRLDPVYGRDLFYPTSSEAKTICELCRKKTLNRNQLKICKDVGWDVELDSKYFKFNNDLTIEEK